MIPLGDVVLRPAIGTPERDAQEKECIDRARALLHEHDGRICDALHYLEDELRQLPDDPHRYSNDEARGYARELVSHVEQCWATEILR